MTTNAGGYRRVLRLTYLARENPELKSKKSLPLYSLNNEIALFLNVAVPTARNTIPYVSTG